MLRSFTLLAVLLITTAAFPAVLYRSDFVHLPNGTQQLPGWTLSGGEYAVQDGWLTVKSERSNPEALLPVKVVGDFTFRAKVRGAMRVHRCALTYGPYRLEVNNQFGRIALHSSYDQPLAAAGGYGKYLQREDMFELRLVRRLNQLLVFADSRKLFAYTLPEKLAGPQPLSLFSGWGTNLAWSEISVTDQPDESEWYREQLHQPTGGKYVEVIRVRSLRDLQPDDNIYTDGQTAGLKVTLRAVQPAPQVVVLRFRVQGVLTEGREIKTLLDPAKGAEKTFEISAKASERGCFKVRLFAGPDDQHTGWVEDVGSYAVVSPELDTRPRIPNSYFGGHMDAINLGWHLKQARRLGVQSARCHDMMQWTWWDRVQPEGPDQWRWADDYQKQVDALGFQTSGEFLWVPKWAQNPSAPAAVNPATYPPADLDAFGRYVYETVSHYKGSIHVWEMWNEPHYSGFFSGTPAQYAEMLKVAYRGAKRADPTCTVMGGGGVNMQSMGWIAAMLKAAGGNCMDAFSIHYLNPDTAKTDMAWLHEQLASVGFKGPIWNSEESVLTSSFLDQARTDYAEPLARYHYRNACYELVRTYMENLSNGVSRIFYYELADPWRMKGGEKPSAPTPSRLGTSLWDEDWMPRPIAAAYAALALAIDGKPFVQRVDRAPLQAFIFGDAKSATAVHYAMYPSFEKWKSMTLKLPGQGEVMDYMGNEKPVRWQNWLAPLSREPVYVTYTGPTAAATLVRAYEQADLPQ